MSSIRVITITEDQLRAMLEEVVEEAVRRAAPATPPIRPIYLSLAQAAKRIGYEPETLRDWIKAGRLKAERKGSRGNYRVRPEDLEAAMTPSRSRERVDPDAAAVSILARRR